jgi:hypothetical protein
MVTSSRSTTSRVASLSLETYLASFIIIKDGVEAGVLFNVLPAAVKLQEKQGIHFVETP